MIERLAKHSLLKSAVLQPLSLNQLLKGPTDSFLTSASELTTGNWTPHQPRLKRLLYCDLRSAAAHPQNLSGYLIEDWPIREDRVGVSVKICWELLWCDIFSIHCFLRTVDECSRTLVLCCPTTFLTPRCSLQCFEQKQKAHSSIWSSPSFSFVCC